MITLIVIARNEQRCLARCLRSASPHVDGMLVVDTGSVDETVNISRAEGARLAHFDWIDDFSAARNFALTMTKGSWRIVLDADEWIEAGGEELKAFAAAHRTSPLVGQIVIRHAFEAGGVVQYAPSWTSRILPPDGVGYEGIVHEQLVHRWPVTRVATKVGHDGFLPEQQAGKTDRNISLLRKAISSNPLNPYLHFQAGREWQSRNEFASAAGAYEQCRRLLDWDASKGNDMAALVRRFPWLHDLAVRLIFCLKRAGRLEDVNCLIDSEAMLWNESPDFHFAAADALLAIATARPGNAASLFPVMESHWRTCVQIGETPDLEGHVEGRGSHLAIRNLDLLLRLRAEFRL